MNWIERGGDFLGSFLGEDTGEILAVVIEEEEPEQGDDDGYRSTRKVQQEMIEKNIYDDRAKQSESERDEAVDEQERSTYNLKGADEVHPM